MIAIIDSGGANIASVRFALERLGYESVLTGDPDVIAGASHVILPGVGAAKDAMAQLQRQDGLIECIKGLTQPVLGICLGMQLLFDHSEEGDVPLLGLIPGKVTRFEARADLIVPHMGWNSVQVKEAHPLLENAGAEPFFYFVHSYKAGTGAHTVGACTYGQEFTAIAARDNFMGGQFHPERSGAAGAQIFRNFLEL